MNEHQAPGAPQSPSPPAAPAGPVPYRYRGAGCSCRRCQSRGLRAPIILIAIGVMFLIPQFVSRLDFGDLWPVILIVIGVMLLIEQTASTEGHRG